jgi:hypothetical protein
VPKLTAEQRAELERQLADDDDDDFEFELSEGDRSVRLPWSRREQLGELGFKVPAKAPAAPKGAQDPKTGGGGRSNVTSVFGPRQRNSGS